MDFQGLSIGNRLRIGLGIITGFMVILTITGVWSLSAMNNKLEEITQVNDRKIALAQSLRDSSDGIDKSMLTIALLNNEETAKVERKKVEDTRAAFRPPCQALRNWRTARRGRRSSPRSRTISASPRMLTTRPSSLSPRGIA